VAAQAAAAGLRDDRRRDLVLAVSELATNGLRHGPGAGVIRTWREDSGILCEVEGAGVIADPLAGRHCPTLSQMYGWGLYVVHQACDLVRIHSGNGRTAVRVQMALD
jgi:anti-sigma regulatory factor (Ser/Thr protein kinase)